MMQIFYPFSTVWWASTVSLSIVLSLQLAIPFVSAAWPHRLPSIVLND